MMHATSGSVAMPVAEGTALGAVVAIPSGAAVPAGFLDANGQAVSRVTYLDYFLLVGTTYGAGDGVLTFNVPNMADAGGMTHAVKVTA